MNNIQSPTIWSPYFTMWKCLAASWSRQYIHYFSQYANPPENKALPTKNLQNKVPSRNPKLTFWRTLRVFYSWEVQFVLAWVQILAQLFAVYYTVDKHFISDVLASSFQNPLTIPPDSFQHSSRFLPPGSSRTPPHFPPSGTHSLIRTPQPLWPIPLARNSLPHSPTLSNSFSVSFFQFLTSPTCRIPTSQLHRIPSTQALEYWSCFWIPGHPILKFQFHVLQSHSLRSPGTGGRGFWCPGSPSHKLPVPRFWGFQLPEISHKGLSPS